MQELDACGIWVIVKRDIPASEAGGFVVPDIAKKKPSTGAILSVGGSVADAKIAAGKKAYFAQGNGFTLELEDGEEVTVLNEGQIIAVV